MDDLASMECESEGTVTELGHPTEKRPRGRPRTRPDLDATAISGKPTQLTVATIPYRILARIRKQGPMTYSEISAHIAGSRMVRRDKYIDPAIYNLRRRGYIELSRVAGCKGRWKITQSGRLALRDAKPSVDQVMRRKQLEREKYQRMHLAHIERQRRCGIPDALIFAGLEPFQAGTLGSI